MMMIVNISTCNPVKIQTSILPIPKTSNSPPSPPQCCPSNHDKPPDVAPLKSLSSNLSSPCHFERSPKISLRHAAHRKWSTLRKAHCQPEVWPSDVSPLPPQISNLYSQINHLAKPAVSADNFPPHKTNCSSPHPPAFEISQIQFLRLITLLPAHHYSWK